MAAEKPGHGLLGWKCHHHQLGDQHTVAQRDDIGKVKSTDQGEMAGVGRQKKLLFIVSCGESGVVSKS